MMTKDDLKELKKSDEYKRAFSEALEIHKRIHDKEATHFRRCTECKSGFALLLISELQTSLREARL